MTDARSALLADRANPWRYAGLMLGYIAAADTLPIDIIRWL